MGSGSDHSMIHVPLTQGELKLAASLLTFNVRSLCEFEKTRLKKSVIDHKAQRERLSFEEAFAACANGRRPEAYDVSGEWYGIKDEDGLLEQDKATRQRHQAELINAQLLGARAKGLVGVACLQEAQQSLLCQMDESFTVFAVSNSSITRYSGGGDDHVRGGVALVSTVEPQRMVELREAPEYGDEEGGLKSRVAGLAMLLSTESGDKFWVFNYHLKIKSHKEHKLYSSFLDAKGLMAEDPAVPAVFAGDFNRTIRYLQREILDHEALALDATELESEVLHSGGGRRGGEVDYAFVARQGAPKPRRDDRRNGGYDGRGGGGGGWRDRGGDRREDGRGGGGGWRHRDGDRRDGYGGGSGGWRGRDEGDRRDGGRDGGGWRGRDGEDTHRGDDGRGGGGGWRDREDRGDGRWRGSGGGRGGGEWGRGDGRDNYQKRDRSW